MLRSHRILGLGWEVDIIRVISLETSWWLEITTPLIKFDKITPWKINGWFTYYSHHPWKERNPWSEPNLHEDMFQPLIFRGVSFVKLEHQFSTVFFSGFLGSTPTHDGPWFQSPPRSWSIFRKKSQGKPLFATIASWGGGIQTIISILSWPNYNISPT